MTLSANVTLGMVERQGNPAVVLPAVLRELYFGRRTGLLYVEKDPDRVSFRFVNGEVVSGSSSSEHGRLGETMVRYGLLARPDLDRALDVVNREGRRLGPVLRELGVIEAPRLEQALSLHIREMLLTTLRWEEAYHVFEQEELPDLAREDLTLRSSTGELILELVRSISNMDTVRQGLGDIDQIVVPVPDPPFRLERITLTPADGYVLSRVDGKATGRTIIEITPLPKEEVERSLLGLLCTGVVEYRPRVSKQEAHVDASAPAGVPGLSPLAPGYRPERLADVRASSGPGSSGANDQRFAAGPVATMATLTPPAVAAPVNGRSRGVEFHKALERAYEALEGKNHFQVLGLLQTASVLDVKDAYARQVKRFPPELLTACPPELFDKVQAILTRLRDAYQALSIPEDRDRYEASLPKAAPTSRVRSNPDETSDPSATLDPGYVQRPPRVAVDAERLTRAVAAAETDLAEGRFRDAIVALEAVIAMTDGTLERRARLLLARSYSMSPEGGRKAESELLRLVRLDPKDVDALFALGKFYQTNSLGSRARAMFQKVVELQPGHKAAAAELAALKPESAAGGGLLNRLRRQTG